MEGSSKEPVENSEGSVLQKETYMTGSYAEAGVKRKDTLATIGLRFLMIFLAVLLFFAAFFNQWMMVLAAALICLDIFLIPMLKTDYEYIFCDGQFDFDRINGGARRKHMLRVDMEEVEIAAPKNSHALDEFRSSEQGTVKNFTSGRSDEKVYVLVARQNGKLLKILFEPSEKMIACMKNKSPRKVVEY